jgi:prepilin-type N-terminal cleavage/methylation domain-containing protein
MKKERKRRETRGFTLVEVLIATLLVGLAIAALVAANGSFSMANVAGADLSTAEFLAEQIRS